MTGERMYTAWRDSMNAAAARRGNQKEKHWTDLKPWVRSVWNDAARRAAASEAGIS